MIVYGTFECQDGGFQPVLSKLVWRSLQEEFPRTPYQKRGTVWRTGSASSWLDKLAKAPIARSLYTVYMGYPTTGSNIAHVYVSD